MSFSIEAADSIVALEDQPVLRNLLVTQGYSDLSLAFARVLGKENITWFTVASWSSKLVGQFLRDEEVPGPLRDLVDGHEPTARRLGLLNHRLTSLHAGAAAAVHNGLQGALRCAVRDMRMYLGRGNTEVFAELAPLFTEFLRIVGVGVRPDRDKLDQMIKQLRPGPAQPDRVKLLSNGDLVLEGKGGQALLGEALQHYYEAILERDAKAKAELILMANACIGLHEQTRLQTYIAGSLDAPIRDALIDGTHDGLLESVVGELLGRKLHATVDLLLGPVVDGVEDVFRHFATRFMMSLKLPDGVLWLGRDLPAPPGRPLFPEPLRTITNPELRTMLEHHGALAERSSTPLPGILRRIEAAAEALLEGTTDAVASGSAACDWARFSQRMRYILELFRSRQQDQTLLQPTFSAVQVDAMRAGRIPDGPLS